MSKVLLTTLNAKYIHLNLAIRLLYDLNKDRSSLDWYEFTIKNDPMEVARHCIAYDVVCFSCYIWNISQTLRACEAIKALRPEVKILLGGPEVSYEWEGVIAQDHVDYIILGEGEIPFQRFLEHYPDVSKVPNLVYKEGGSLMCHKENVQFDLASLEGHNPYSYEPLEDLYNKVCYIETSRGCPYKCAFCLASLDNKVRYLPMQTIKDNLLYLMRHGRTIKFLDRTFNVKKDFTIELFQFILDHHRPGNVFQFEITADIVHPDIIAFIQEKVPPGLFRFEIGIQTVNQESNREVSRKQNFEKTSQVIRQLENKIEMHLDLIVGLPLEYWDDLKFSFESTFKLYPPELQLGFLKFLKGTPVREKYEQYGYKFDLEPPYQIIESDFLSKEELRKVTLLEQALEIYWNKKRACRTLRYVAAKHGIFDFLLGLGTYFEQHSHAHKHTLKEIYQHIAAYISADYDDPVLLQLLAMDYYTYHKVKPMDLFEMEVDRSVRSRIVDAQGLNHHKFRFAIVPTSFNVRAMVKEAEWVYEADHLIVAFDGQGQGELVFAS